MAVRIRLQRKGAKHMAFFRIVAADSRSPRDGRFIEQLGYYDPLRDPPEIKVDTEKVIGWLSNGALPTETVESLFRRVGIMQTWHEVKRGKSLDELRHIEDEARKRLEARASMEKRKKEVEKTKEAEASEASEAGTTDETSESAAEEAAPEVEAQAPAADEAGDGAGAQSDAGESKDEGEGSESASEEERPDEPEPAPVSQEEQSE